MLRLGVALICIYAVVTASPLSKNIRPRIINGQEASLGQFPWQAALYLLINGTNYFCGGTIISEEWIVTSGSCLDEVESATVQTGIINIDGDEGTEVRNSAELILHEDYNWQTMRASIGLIRLERPLTWNEHISPIDMSEEIVEGEVEVVASGWGSHSDSDLSLSQFLHYVYLDTITNKECLEFYGKDAIYDGDLCAVSKSEEPKGPCAGDTGGPLVANVNTSPLLVGITDFLSGDGCEAGHPAGFTRVSTYREWIRNNTGI